MQVIQRYFLVTIKLTDVTGAGRILGLFLVRPDV